MTPDRLSGILNAVSIKDVVSEATEQRPESSSHPRPAADSTTGNPDFAPREPEIEFQRPVYEEPEEPYDAKSNAEGLVYGLCAIDSVLLNTVATLKGRHNAGGSKVIKKMKAARIKEMTGEELTDLEKKLVDSFKVFKADMELLSGSITPSQAKLDHLVKMAIPWCEENQFQTSKSLAFWGNYVGGLVENITKILMS